MERSTTKSAQLWEEGRRRRGLASRGGGGDEGGGGEPPHVGGFREMNFTDE